MNLWHIFERVTCTSWHHTRQKKNSVFFNSFAWRHCGSHLWICERNFSICKVLRLRFIVMSQLHFNRLKLFIDLRKLVFSCEITWIIWGNRLLVASHHDRRVSSSGEGLTFVVVDPALGCTACFSSAQLFNKIIANRRLLQNKFQETKVAIPVYENMVLFCIFTTYLISYFITSPSVYLFQLHFISLIPSLQHIFIAGLITLRGRANQHN